MNVVYIPRVYLIEINAKLTCSCFSLYINYYFVIESIHAFSFANNVVVYQALLVWGRYGKLGCGIFIVNVKSMHLSGTWQFWPFKKSWTGISLAAYELSYSGAQKLGVQKFKDAMEL